MWIKQDGKDSKLLFFLNSGFPFLHVAMTISPTDAEGRRFKRPPIPKTETTYKFLAPVLSAQFITVLTFIPKVTRILLPEEPPEKQIKHQKIIQRYPRLTQQQTSRNNCKLQHAER